MFSTAPSLAINVVLDLFKNDDDKAAAILRELKDVKSYHADLLDRMLASPKLAALIPDVFANCFDTFPAEALRCCIASADVNQDTLLCRLGSTSNPLHRSEHAELMRRVLESPMNLHHYRFVAAMLTSHTRHDVLTLLAGTNCPQEDRWLWFVREVEAARGERLINEAGRILH